MKENIKMAIAKHFYHASTRKIIVAFGTLFNEIYIKRDDGKEIKVPLTYASKEKFYLTLQQDYKRDRIHSIVLPRMGFMVTDMHYDSQRKISSLARLIKDDKRVYAPVPYNFNIELSIYARNMDDGLQIVEQIIPFFKPSFNITIEELEEMDIKRDIPIILDSISHEDTSEGDVADSFRMLRWDLMFTVKANFYGPVIKSAIIKHSYVDVTTNNVRVDERYKADVVPESAFIDDLWEYNEEIITRNIVPVEVDIALRQHDSGIFIGDSCSINVR